MARKREFEFGDEELPPEPFGAPPAPVAPQPALEREPAAEFDAEAGAELDPDPGFEDDPAFAPEPEFASEPSAGAYEPLPALEQDPAARGVWRRTPLTDPAAAGPGVEDTEISPAEADAAHARRSRRYTVLAVLLLLAMIPIGLIAGSILADDPRPELAHDGAERPGWLRLPATNEPRVERRRRPEPRPVRRVARRPAPVRAPAPEPVAVAPAPEPVPAPAPVAPPAPVPAAPAPVAAPVPVPAGGQEFGFER